MVLLRVCILLFYTVHKRLRFGIWLLTSIEGNNKTGPMQASFKMLSLPTSYNYVLFEKKTINSEIHELQSQFCPHLGM